MPRCSVLEIETASKLALEAFGAKDWIATSVARAVADAEAHGNVICGLYYLESYCRQLATGRVSGSVDPKVTASRPGSILSDAGYGFAQPAFEAALPMAVAVARENGTASLAVAHAHTCTSLGYFTAQLAAEGLMAIGFTNASPVVAPPGGNQKVIGTNPIAMSVPDGAGGLAVEIRHHALHLCRGQFGPRCGIPFREHLLRLLLVGLLRGAGHSLALRVAEASVPEFTSFCDRTHMFIYFVTCFS